MKSAVRWLALVPLLLLVSACGEQSPSSGPDAKEQMDRYARCMAEHGVEIPEAPAGGDPGGVVRASASGPPPPDPEKLRQADENCRHLLPDGGKVDEGERAAALEEQRAYARCMRENGVPDFPDPDPNTIDGDAGTGQVSGSSEARAPVDTDAFDRADRKCLTTAGVQPPERSRDK